MAGRDIGAPARAGGVIPSSGARPTGRPALTAAGTVGRRGPTFSSAPVVKPEDGGACAPSAAAPGNGAAPAHAHAPAASPSRPPAWSPTAPVPVKGRRSSAAAASRAWADLAADDDGE
jgi:hypothetical protein